MVSDTSTLPKDGRIKQQDVQVWLGSVSERRGDKDMLLLHEVCEFVVSACQDGQEESAYQKLHHALAVGDILVDLGLDSKIIAAAILHRVLSGSELRPKKVRKRFGKAVSGMVKDLDRIDSVAGSSAGVSLDDEERHVENLRRMLLTIVDDIRVVLVLLAERLYKMRVLKRLPKEIRVWEARETMDIYAPLANRLGIWQIKWELEDLCLRYMDKGCYKEIAGLLDGSRKERECFVDDVIKLLQYQFAAAGIKAVITGRPKHIYSIWKKMKRKGIGFDKIFDLRAVRVLVKTEADCYAALGIVHGLRRHIPGEFDDYIATPKANLYQSIHTAVIGPEDKHLEIQIRTKEMHRHAELGVAAHWRYKESGSKDAEFERRVALMRSWLESQNEIDVEQDFKEAIKTEFEAHQVYVLTPKGKIMELPKGSTPLDFAYLIHTEVGHRCRGAKVDGRIVQLTQPLENGQVVEILTAKEGAPGRDWLSPHLGYLRTSSARSKVRQWFKHQDFQEHVKIGSASLEREFKRLGIELPDLTQEATRHNFQKPETLLAAIGRGEISPLQVATRIREHESVTGDQVHVVLHRKRRKGEKRQQGEVIVEGVGDLMTNIAHCCKPVPYDPIMGFITRGRGITVHRADCSVIRNLDESQHERLADVVWSDQRAEASYQVDIQVLASDRKGLLRDITSILTNAGVDLTGVNTKSDSRTDRAVMRFTIEVADMQQLSRILGRIAQLPDVLEVKRCV